jgi:hypothetical protein
LPPPGGGFGGKGGWVDSGQFSVDRKRQSRHVTSVAENGVQMVYKCTFFSVLKKKN